MEGILTEFLSHHQLREVIAGAPLEFDRIPEENQQSVVVILLHCCMNGPVSPHVETVFPIIGRTSLDAECGFRVTNGTLRKTCNEVKLWLTEQEFEEGFMFLEEGEFWPNSYVKTT